MLRLAAFSAALTRPLGTCMDLPNVTLVEYEDDEQRRAPASAYALDALSRLEVPTDARVVTISGPPGKFIHHMEPIRQRSPSALPSGPSLLLPPLKPARRSCRPCSEKGIRPFSG